MQKIVVPVAAVGAGRAPEPEWYADTKHLLNYLLPRGARADLRRIPGVAYGDVHEIGRLCDDIHGEHEARTVTQVEAMIARLAIDPTLELAGIAEPIKMTVEAVYTRWKHGKLRLDMRLIDAADQVNCAPDDRVVTEKAGFREALDLAPQEASRSKDSGLPIHWLRLGTIHGMTQPDAYQLQQDATKYMVSVVPMLGAGALLS